jgi:hypothetical protein
MAVMAPVSIKVAPAADVHEPASSSSIATTQ